MSSSRSRSTSSSSSNNVPPIVINRLKSAANQASVDVILILADNIHSPQRGADNARIEIPAQSLASTLQELVDRYLADVIQDIASNRIATFTITPTITVIATSATAGLHVQANEARTEWLPTKITGVKFRYDLGFLEFDYLYK